MGEVWTALEGLDLSVLFRRYRWAYAALNGAHVLGIALLVGAIIPLDLRLMGAFRRLPLAPLASLLVPCAMAGLAMAVITGTLLFAARAVDYGSLTLFWIKMTLVIAATANALLLRLATPWRGRDNRLNARLATAGLLSAILWLSALACGRMIAYWL